MENLNAEQIIKALECCTRSGCSDNETKDCPLKPYEDCTTRLATNALALINSQEQRIKELIEERDGLENLVKTSVETQNRMSETIEELTEENEKLEAMVDMWKSTAYCEKDRLSSIKADTIHKLKRDLYVEFLYLAKIQKDNEPNMTSQEVFDALDRVAKRHLDVSGSDNLCVSCGKIIPEGRQVCPLCECKRSDEGR